MRPCSCGVLAESTDDRSLCSSPYRNLCSFFGLSSYLLFPHLLSEFISEKALSHLGRVLDTKRGKIAKRVATFAEEESGTCTDIVKEESRAERETGREMPFWPRLGRPPHSAPIKRCLSICCRHALRTKADGHCSQFSLSHFSHHPSLWNPSLIFLNECNNRWTLDESLCSAFGGLCNRLARGTAEHFCRAQMRGGLKIALGITINRRGGGGVKAVLERQGIPSGGSR